MPTLAKIAAFADATLRTSQISDYPGALNGLQVDTSADVVKVAAAVDFSRRTVTAAIAAGAQLLLVHHGAFWGGAVPLTGNRFRVVRELVDSSMGVYSSHLPLDCHPTLGNNVLLAKELGLQPTAAFGKFQELPIGVAGESETALQDLVDSASKFSASHGGHVHVTGFGKNRKIGRWGICSGAGVDADTLKEAADRGIMTLLTGEAPHWASVYAEDNDLALICVGHYASETLGVQALAATIADEFGIQFAFIAAPTGT